MKHMRNLVIILCIAFFTSGCATGYYRIANESMPKPKHGIYPAVRINTSMIHSSIRGIFEGYFGAGFIIFPAILDFPFSIVFDTALIPYDVYDYFKEKAYVCDLMDYVHSLPEHIKSIEYYSLGEFTYREDESLIESNPFRELDKELFTEVLKNIEFQRSNIWKVPTITIIHLDDGTKLELKVSMHGSAFKILGQKGLFVIPDENLRKRWVDELKKARKSVYEDKTKKMN